MKRNGITNEEVEREIKELEESPYVALARREQRLKYKRRQRLYNLRFLEKKGRELASTGITLDTIDKQLEMLENAEIEEQNFMEDKAFEKHIQTPPSRTIFTTCDGTYIVENE